MPYVTRKGTVEEKRTGFLAAILGFLLGLLEILRTFVATLVSPEAANAAKQRALRDPRNRAYNQGGRRNRIAGVDDIGGGGEAACPTGG